MLKLGILAPATATFFMLFNGAALAETASVTCLGQTYTATVPGGNCTKTAAYVTCTGTNPKDVAFANCAGTCNSKGNSSCSVKAAANEGGTAPPKTKKGLLPSVKGGAKD